MANSAGRRKDIRAQNVSMRKALEKLKRGTVTAGVSGAGTLAATETVAAGAGAGLGAAGGIMASIKELLGKKGVKGGIATAGGFLVLQALMQRLLSSQQEGQQYDLANQQMDSQAESMSPEAMKEEALQPITRAQRDYAMQMLMQQLGGRPTNRARGEAWT